MTTSRILIPTVILIAGAFLLFPPRGHGSPGPDGPGADVVISYPETERIDGGYTLHGERIEDPYRWLEEDEDERVVAWDLVQAAFLEEYLEGFTDRARFEKRLTEEYGLGGMRSVPKFEGGLRWFTFRPKGANHAVLYRTNETATQDPIVVLDPNTWSEDGTAGMQSWEVSPNGKLVAYRRDESGSEDATVLVRDVASGKDLPDRITRTKFSRIIWNEDSAGFFYARMPDPESVPADQKQYNRRIHFHRLGTLVLDDPMLYGQGRPMLEARYLYRSSDEKRLYVMQGMPYKNFEIYEATVKGDRLVVQPVITGLKDRTWVDCVGETLILNSDRNTGNREVFTARRRIDGTPGTWKKVPFPSGERGVIEDVIVVNDSLLVCHMKKNVISRLYVTPIAGGPVREILLPGPGTVGRSIQTKKGDTNIWFSFQSYARPPTVCRCDVSGKDLALVVEETLPTTLDLSQLVSTQTTYKSKDGTDVPIFFLHRKDVKLDGSAPTILYGYGGFRVGMSPYFSRTRAVWAEQGGVLAVAALRGGNEFGEDWHQAGCLANKQNVFDDFISAADWLVETGRASRERLAIQGGSNGGLLTAVVVNQRPDLCRAAISSVPLTDMLRFHKFQFAKSWTMEYGDPDKQAEFAWIRPYSPYHNVKAGTPYPAVLFTAGLKDGRVDAFHARKMAAQLQHATTSDYPILLRIDRKGGHGAAGLKRRLDGVLDQWSFLLMQMDK